MEEIHKYIFAAIFLVQFLFPFLASKIKEELKEKGYEMKSYSFLSFLNVSGFWLEAQSMNLEAKSKLVRNLLGLYYLWWLSVVLFVASWAFV